MCLQRVPSFQQLPFLCFCVSAGEICVRMSISLPYESIDLNHLFHLKLGVSW